MTRLRHLTAILAGLSLALALAPARAQLAWPGPTDAASYTFAGNRMGFPTQIYTFPSTPSHLSDLWTPSPPYAVSNLRILWANFAVVADGRNNPETCPGNALTIDFATVIIGSTFYPVTFGGATTVQLGDCEFAWSDPLRDASGNLVTIPANTGYTVRSSGTPSPASGNIVIAPAPISYNRGVTAYGEGQAARSATPQYGKRLSGTIGGGGGGSSFWGPAMAVGTGWDGSPVFLVVGDSIGAGQGDGDTYNAATNPRGQVGFIARALDDAAASTRYSFANLSQHGTKPSDQASIAAGQWRLRIRALRALPNRPFNRVISQMGHNALSSGQPLTRLQAEMRDFWQFWRDQCPSCPMFQTTFTQRTNASNGTLWTDPAQQTPKNPIVDEHPTGTRWLARTWLLTPGALPSYVTPLDVTPGFVDATLTGSLKVPSGSWTLNTAIATQVTSLSLAGAVAPAEGDVYVVNPGTTSGVTQAMAVQATTVTGSGPWTVNLNGNTASGRSFPVGTTVKRASSLDGTHPGAQLYKDAAQLLIQAKQQGKLQ